ncbi:MAG TPA: nitrate reductase associated protein [Ferruginibacter sp.]|nr:nitrate reductase associated protein [Ferruginibacter sp.]HMP20155.1 nitrate reductase associated protein [Ferruginibacter sp.]
MSTTHPKASVFEGIKNMEYFNFEEDFVEKNIRCIPMIVRFKMDTAGIKLQLAEWAKFSTSEKLELALKPCSSAAEIKQYFIFLTGLVKKYTGHEAKVLTALQTEHLQQLNEIPGIVAAKASSFNWSISREQWLSLTILQRFALLKLCRSEHENKNFPTAMKEFQLVH